MTTLLQVRNLRVAYASRRGELWPALAGVDFDLAPREILGVLGESGSGKSTLAAALVNLLPSNGIIQSGTVSFEGRNLLATPADELRSLRGHRIGLIFQEPSSSLHPTIRVGQQVSDVLAAHKSLDRPSLRQKTLQVLETVFPDNAQRVARSYPHELSGGQKQRVLIAQAIACDPALLMADEPTASLDTTTQREVLSFFHEIRERLGLSIILITHNPLLLSGLADRILVLYAGRVAELGPAAQVLTASKHPYTTGLLHCVPPQPVIHDSERAVRLPIIAGEPPDLTVLATGCQFEPRCADRMQICNDRPPETVAVGQAHCVSCFKFTA